MTNTSELFVDEDKNSISYSDIALLPRVLARLLHDVCVCLFMIMASLHMETKHC